MISKTKVLLLGTVFALGAAAMSTSFAADLPRKAPAAAPVYPPPVATWAGCYLGAAGGVVNHRSSGLLDFEGLATFSASGNETGGIYGGYGGCQSQTGAFVYGVEGDFSGLSGDISRNIDSVGLLSSKLDWLATVRGRFGYAVNNIMVYATGGVAFAEVKNSLLIPGFPGASNSTTKTGWTIGGGVDYMFTPNWIGRLEFLYADLGDQTTSYAATGLNYTSSLSHELIIGRVGLAYKW